MVFLGLLFQALSGRYLFVLFALTVPQSAPESPP